MSADIVDLAEQRLRRKPRPRGTFNPTWPLIILGCLTFWTWIAFAAVAEYLESLFA